ncbi:hypothetical protein SAVIM40S_08301 [Streptomyces avidinii]
MKPVATSWRPMAGRWTIAARMPWVSHCWGSVSSASASGNTSPMARPASSRAGPPFTQVSPNAPVSRSRTRLSRATAYLSLSGTPGSTGTFGRSRTVVAEPQGRRSRRPPSSVAERRVAQRRTVQCRWKRGNGSNGTVCRAMLRTTENQPAPFPGSGSYGRGWETSSAPLSRRPRGIARKCRLPPSYGYGPRSRTRRASQSGVRVNWSESTDAVPPGVCLRGSSSRVTYSHCGGWARSSARTSFSSARYSGSTASSGRISPSQRSTSVPSTGGGSGSGASSAAYSQRAGSPSSRWWKGRGMTRTSGA